MISIFIHNILPHPDNPRKDLGDLTELAASIKQNGILQNLTVVRRGEEKDFLFTCVIGHRRLAAAKLAGLETVPCTVANLTDREQLATMLMENMQRADLTLLEQAGGFQMMMNLGETLQTLAEKTGLSETTVRHRLKLNELNQETLTKKIKGGATLTDLIRLESIKDPKVRNKVMEELGSHCFNYELESALRNQKAEENWPNWKTVLDTFAKPVKRRADNMICAKTYVLASDPEARAIPEDAHQQEYFYARVITQYSNNIELYTRRDTEDQKKINAETERAELARKTVEELREIRDRCFKLRMDFIRNVSVSAKKTPAILDYLVRCLFNPSGMKAGWSGTDNTDGPVAVILGVKGENYREKQEALRREIERILQNDPPYALLLAAYGNSGDREGNGYFDTFGSGRFPGHGKNTALDALYDLLEELGYPISDEECLMMNGEHPLLHLGEHAEDEEDDEDDDGEETEETWNEEDEANE